MFDLSKLQKPSLMDRVRRLFHDDAAPNLFWSWYTPRNFGDWITPFLYAAATGEAPRYFRPTFYAPQKAIFGAGSILRKITVPNTAIVWGSGVISGDDRFAKPAQVLAVRGPITQKRMHDLGYDCPEIFGDPGILLPTVYAPKNVRKTHRIGFIPHFVDLPKFAGEKHGDIKLIDVTQAIPAVIDDILCCEMTVASSLHGLIVSHAFGVPSVWASTDIAIDGDGSKFFDYFESLGIKGALKVPLHYGEGLPDLAGLEANVSLPDHTPLISPLMGSRPF